MIETPKYSSLEAAIPLCFSLSLNKKSAFSPNTTT